VEIILASAIELRQRNAELTRLVDQYSNEIKALNNEISELSSEVERMTPSADLQWGYNV